MGFLKKKVDPITDRSKALSAQIASLEAQIKKLDGKLHEPPPHPRLRSTALPYRPAPRPVAPPSALTPEPVFEPVEQPRLAAELAEPESVPHFNDLGVRKFDLPAAWRRLCSHFRAPPAGQQKLVTYLAAGSIRGLRPLRYEKRVARNRFIALFIVLVCLLWGIIAIFVRSR